MASRWAKLPFLVVLGIIASACASSGDSGSTPTEVASDACLALPPSSDGSVIVDQIESLATDNGLTSVVYRIERGDEVVASGAFGTSVSGVPADPAMNFRVGNVAFGYMGTLLLLFAENSDASLDDPISKWLPEAELTNADEVTLRMLVQNTSGYPDYVRNDEFVDDFLEDPFQQFAPQELIGIGMSIPPWYPPGTAWSYAHTNYVLLGEALEAIGGDDLDVLLQELIINPIGLSGTSPTASPSLPDPALHSFSTERGVFEDTTYWNPSWQTAPGSVVTSNICDFARSAAAIGSGSLLTPDSYEQLLSADAVQFESPPADCPEHVCRQFDEAFHYGLGVLVNSGWVYQGPLFGGFSGISAYLPDEDLAVAIVAVSGRESEGQGNFATKIWGVIADELTPDNIPNG